MLRQISSSTFNAQLKVAAQVVSENPHLYYEIQQGNRVTGEVVDHFRRVFDELTDPCGNRMKTAGPTRWKWPTADRFSQRS